MAKSTLACAVTATGHNENFEAVHDKSLQKTLRI